MAIRTQPVRFTVSCSGCTELVDGQNVNGYRWDDKAKCLVGSGCHECGYTGKRRVRFSEQPAQPQAKKEAADGTS